LAGSNQGNYVENATACSKRELKTTVATQLYSLTYVRIVFSTSFLFVNDQIREELLCTRPIDREERLRYE